MLLLPRSVFLIVRAKRDSGELVLQAAAHGQMLPRKSGGVLEGLLTGTKGGNNDGLAGSTDTGQ